MKDTNTTEMETSPSHTCPSRTNNGSINRNASSECPVPSNVCNTSFGSTYLPTVNMRTSNFEMQENKSNSSFEDHKHQTIAGCLSPRGSILNWSERDCDDYPSHNNRPVLMVDDSFRMHTVETDLSKNAYFRTGINQNASSPYRQAKSSPLRQKQKEVRWKDTISPKTFPSDHFDPCTNESPDETSSPVSVIQNENTSCNPKHLNDVSRQTCDDENITFQPFLLNDEFLPKHDEGDEYDTVSNANSQQEKSRRNTGTSISMTELQHKMKKVQKYINIVTSKELQLLNEIQTVREKRLRMLSIYNKMNRKYHVRVQLRQQQQQKLQQQQQEQQRSTSPQRAAASLDNIYDMESSELLLSCPMTVLAKNETSDSQMDAEIEYATRHDALDIMGAMEDVDSPTLTASSRRTPSPPMFSPIRKAYPV